MESRKVGFILVFIGLALTALQLNGVMQQVFFIAIGCSGLAFWALHHRTQGVMVLSLMAISWALGTMFSWDQFLKYLLYGFSFLIPYMVQGFKQRQHWTLTPGSILVLLSIFTWHGGSFPIYIDGNLATLLVGLIFAVVYAATKQIGFLIPAGILTSLGVISLLELRLQDWMLFVGIGIAFAIAYYFRRILGFIIPSTILINFGIVVSFPSHYQSWLLFLGIGLAFAIVWVLHTRNYGSTWWERNWPLIPAGGLSIFSLSIALSQGVSQDLFIPILFCGASMVLLGLYAAKRNMGLLIPGLMVGSVGIWFAIGYDSSVLLILLAISFLLILLLETRKNTGMAEKWWPIVPATVLLLNGLASIVGQIPGIQQDLLSNLTAGMILIGVGILVMMGHKNHKES